MSNNNDLKNKIQLISGGGDDDFECFVSNPRLIKEVKCQTE